MNRIQQRLLIAALPCSLLIGCGTSSPDVTEVLEPILQVGSKVCSVYAGPDVSTMNHYRGTLHQHSSYSDGASDRIPADYMQQVKDMGLDFVGATEHSDTYDVFTPFGTGEDCVETPDNFQTCFVPSGPEQIAKWDATLDQATAATNDDFLAIRGFEWTSDRFGHINVYFSQNFSNAKTDGGYGASMESFWDWFTRDPLDSVGTGGSGSTNPPYGGGGDGLAHFNHPGDKCVDESDAACDWNAYAMQPDARERLFGMELFNRGRVDRYLPFWFTALDAGWKVSPVGSEDEHGHDFGSEGLPKTVTVASSLDEAGVKDAWLARRTYAQSAGNDFRLTVNAAGHPMGSTIECETGATISYNFEIEPQDGSTFDGSYILFGNGGEEIASGDTSTLTNLVLPVGENDAWYALQLNNAAGEIIGFGSPIWVEIVPDV